MELATIDGITREQAAENYLKALAELTVYMFHGVVMELFQRPDNMAYLYHKRLVPAPEAIAGGIRAQVLTHLAINPPRVRTLDLVSA